MIRNTGLLIFATSDATRNQGKYSSEKLDELEKELSAEFDIEKRAKLAVQMQQTVLDDHAFVFCSFLKNEHDLQSKCYRI
mgnify:CR=1 FL=1